MILTNKTYDVLKTLVTKVFPAVITFLTAILALYKVDASTSAIIIGTLAAISELIGQIIGASSKQYWHEEEAEG